MFLPSQPRQPSKKSAEVNVKTNFSLAPSKLLFIRGDLCIFYCSLKEMLIYIKFLAEMSAE